MSNACCGQIMKMEWNEANGIMEICQLCGKDKITRYSKAPKGIKEEEEQKEFVSNRK